jgi:hypothetical protein
VCRVLMLRRFEGLWNGWQVRRRETVLDRQDWRGICIHLGGDSICIESGPFCYAQHYEGVDEMKL